MRVTQKGQVTIPKHIRDSLGIKPGSEVEFDTSGDHARIAVAGRGMREASRRERIEKALKKYSGTFDTAGMGGKEFVDWLRGPRENVVPD